ncbi:LysM peptidoglycan-binding domain-containing protein [Gimesia panareensis]|uniref:LysM peptidoglycan-binding domain-containing protein n=1 Tax=Gimesia panareensis TaxID=2527978 RepID=UPI00118B7E64|nr:LysM peptidoglycan-binding domain-containing protein [Gimesia panareensis]QDU49950.1 LysM domain/BON superfamily protein [Gimesia panareensis]
MHQDKKVGLALALLVIGFVGAFCLRQEKNSTVEIPELNDPHYLDEQIADKDRTPYLGAASKEPLETQLGSEQTLTGLSDSDRPRSIKETDVAVPTISHTKPGGESKGSNAERWGEMPDFLKEIDLPAEEVTIENQFSDSDLSDTAFEPNQTETVKQPQTPDSAQGTTRFNNETRKPAHNNAWDVNPAQTKSEPASPGQRRQLQYRVHTVRSGETLSEISIRYLGTSRKYREIFNINRDQLRSPNDIREGMKLRIPVYQTPEMKPQSAGRQTNTGTPAVSGKRTVGQMVSQPTLKSDSASVQFEGLIESLSQTPEKTPAGSQDQLKNSAGIGSIPESYRKFIPVPRSPLTPGSQSQGGKSGQSLSQVQPENVDEIVEDLFDRLPDASKQSQTVEQAKTYVIQKGDTLESIALRIYGKRSAAFQIYQKNRDLLKNANYIRPGMKLQLP